MRYYFADNADGVPTLWRADRSPVANANQMCAEAWNLLVLGVVTEQARPDAAAARNARMRAVDPWADDYRGPVA